MKVRYKICIIILFILSIIILYTLLFPSKQFSSYTYETINKSTIDEIRNKDLVEQSFQAEDNYITVGLPIANYGQIIKKGKIIVTITDEQGKKKKYNIKATNIIDNEYYYLNYRFKKNKNYKITIQVKDLKSPITFLTTEKEIKGTNLRVNKKERKENIILSFMYSKKNYFNIWYCLFIISILLCYMTLIKEKDYVKK
ncbi:MAG: hypothetical protein HFJ38_02055 [Bacilli bacterium]|nr:hypothetical protein [Bacilli bacterium]